MGAKSASCRYRRSGTGWCKARSSSYSNLSSVRQESWRVPTGESPVRVKGSARPVVSVATWKATTTAKRTQQSCGVWEGATKW